MIRNLQFLGAWATAVAVACSPATAQQPAETTRAAMVQKGIEFLRQRGQAADGSFSAASGPAITGLCVLAILENRPTAVDDPVVQKGLQYLQQNLRPDGGIYGEGSKHRNYETCVAMQALKAANRDGRYDQMLQRAEAFVRDLQWDEGEGLESSDTAYGGAGYGSHSRPDLSNTSFMIEALHDLGVPGDDPAIQRALKFVSRTQNLESPHNDTEFAAKVDDGGFYYTPAAGGQSQAGQTANGGLRSYGSMTYAGLKSMIYAGVSQDDPRVQAALQFIRETYSLESNPGMDQAGLYYYYHTFAKALDAAGIDTLTDASGTAHDWRRELIETLAEKQQADGSWVNGENPRWLEGDAQLVTAYALLALAHCEQP